MSEEKIKGSHEMVTYDGVIYTLNEYEKSANIVDFKKYVHEIIIPHFISHNSVEYVIKNISEDALYNSNVNVIQFVDDSEIRSFDIRSLCFSEIESITIPPSVTKIGENAFYCTHSLKKVIIPSNSKLQAIEKDTFYDSKIECLEIQSKSIELKEGWCNFTRNLKDITINPRHERYRCQYNKIIIGKTKIDQKKYDQLVFYSRDIRGEITIPDFIEHICTSCFSFCNQITKIKFPKESKLKTINDFAFSNVLIRKISIPSSVTIIGKSSFEYCKELSEVKIPKDSNLQIIDERAFFLTRIECFEILSNSVELKNGWCRTTSRLNKVILNSENKRYHCLDNKIIIGKSSIEQEYYDRLVFLFQKR